MDMHQAFLQELEMEMGLCLVFIFGARHVLALTHTWVRTGAVALFLGFLIWQATPEERG